MGATVKYLQAELMGFHNQPRCGTIQQFTSVGCKRFSQLQRTYKAMTDPIDEKSAPSHSDTTRGTGLARSLIRLGLGGVMIGAHDSPARVTARSVGADGCA